MLALFIRACMGGPFHITTCTCFTLILQHSSAVPAERKGERQYAAKSSITQRYTLIRHPHAGSEAVQRFCASSATASS
ncbi:uncharacterized protein B0I36DRAFT_332623 [Microdochium trichocladiopsis]|uniref:Uncharacterized protein n=1 Tax=Microdochium trichocladiopsis TaxID=1682393 RepID=A0A9P9BLS2_9PEZI|nr:uncharacterized protein B0I36DRAFT_332623 [Microdochium trichocladiopsis]KAH7025179.1 hypothetical protein B0I36DRAFT_332623 [Microdochium trichocladiopsis]